MTLTAYGRNRLRAARKVQAEQVRSQFADRMSESEASVVLGVLRRLANASQNECGALAD